VTFEAFVKSLMTNFAAYRQNQEASQDDETRTRSQYFSYTQEVMKKKEGIVRPLLSSDVPQESKIGGCFLDFVKYIAFTLPSFLAVLSYILFVCRSYDSIGRNGARAEAA